MLLTSEVNYFLIFPQHGAAVHRDGRVTSIRAGGKTTLRHERQHFRSDIKNTLHMIILVAMYIQYCICVTMVEPLVSVFLN